MTLSVLDANPYHLLCNGVSLGVGGRVLRGGRLSSPAYLGLRGQQDERRVTASKVVTATEYASLVSFSRLGVTCQCRWPPVTLPPLFGVRCGVGGNSEGRSVACDARWWPGGEQVPKRVSLAERLLLVSTSLSAWW